MKFVLYSNLVSPHTLPLAKELISYYSDCMYICQRHGGEPFRTALAIESLGDKLLYEEDDTQAAAELLAGADIVLTGVRDFELMERRIAAGKVTLYQSERWFKPENILAFGNSEYGGCGIWVDGFWKMLLPFAQKRARRIVRLFESEKFMYLPIGIHAARDMVRMCRLLDGDLSCICRGPELQFERYPGGKIWCLKEQYAKNCLTTTCLNRSRMWGYFVAPSVVHSCSRQSGVNKVLWVGRMLRLKCVDTVIRAVGNMPNMTLSLVGNGPDERRLRRIANGYSNISFSDMVRIDEVRKLMRSHDTYIFSSNAFDGWGAVVNEAIEEGMRVYGTYEAGSSATILPNSNLFHVNDWKSLRNMLVQSGERIDKGIWSVANAARNLVQIVDEVQYGI